MMNRFEIIFDQLDETSPIIIRDDAEVAGIAEIRAISEESDAIEEIMRVWREMSQQTRSGRFTTS
jgi:hypothetical protein